ADHPVEFDLDRRAGLGGYPGTIYGPSVFFTAFPQTPRRKPKNLRAIIVVENALIRTFYAGAPRQLSATILLIPCGCGLGGESRGR
ncbi:MAG: hypothetical protein Q8N47_04235, partial [Bryobacterales bacterium]|nr:hypothetical protein [Bryobacterales bacterium]